MEYLKLGMQLIVALGIFNVWLLRFGKATAYRGGGAQNLKEEFAVYGLPSWALVVVGLCKLTLAVMLLAGIWYPTYTQPAAIGMAILMTGAVAMHVKVGDPMLKALPATAMLAMSLLIVFL